MAKLEDLRESMSEEEARILRKWGSEYSHRRGPNGEWIETEFPGKEVALLQWAEGLHWLDRASLARLFADLSPTGAVAALLALLRSFAPRTPVRVAVPVPVPPVRTSQVSLCRITPARAP